MGRSRGNYGDWKRGRYGSGSGPDPEPTRKQIQDGSRSILPKYREFWQLVDDQRKIVPALVYPSQAEAERAAAFLNRSYGTTYEVVKVDQDKPLKPEKLALDDKIPDPDKDIVYLAAPRPGLVQRDIRA